MNLQRCLLWGGKTKEMIRMNLQGSVAAAEVKVIVPNENCPAKTGIGTVIWAEIEKDAEKGKELMI